MLKALSSQPKFKQILIGVYLFLFIYLPPILPVNILHLLTGWSLLGLIILRVETIDVAKSLMRSTVKIPLLLLVGAVFVYLIFGIFRTVSVTQVYIYVLIAEALICSVYLCVEFRRNAWGVETLLRLLGYIIIAQFILVALSIAIQPVHDWFVEIFVARGYGEISRAMTWRLFGFANNLTFAMPLFHSTYATIALHYYVNEKKHFYLAVSLIAIASAVVNARIALIIFLITIVPIWVMNFFYEGGKNRKFLLALTGILVLFAALFSFVMYFASPDTLTWILWAFIEIINLPSGVLSSGFFNDVSQQIFIPAGSELLFGRGSDIFVGWEGVRSDLGYINDLWVGGAIYALLLWIGMLTYALSVLPEREIHADRSIYSVIALSLTIAYLLGNFKGSLFVPNEFLNFMILIVLVCHMVKKDSEESVVD